MGKKVNITSEQYKRIQEVYSTGEKSIISLAYELGLDRTVVKRGARELGVDKTPTYNTHAGIKIEWTDDMLNKLREGYMSNLITVEDLAQSMGLAACTLQAKAKELGITKKRKSAWNAHKIQQLKELAKDCTILQMSQQLDICDDVVRRKLRELEDKYGLKYKRVSAKGKNGKVITRRVPYGGLGATYLQRLPTVTVKGDNGRVEFKADFVFDLGNPRLTAVDIARKYAISDAAVLRWRKKLFGKIYLQASSGERISSAEYEVHKMLDELDLAYIPHKVVLGKQIDIYLGCKKIIEVDGVYWHSGDAKIEKDNRIRAYYRENGYEVLVVKEQDILDGLTATIKNNISNFFWGSPASDGSKKYHVNASKSGVRTSNIVRANGGRIQYRAKPRLNDRR